VAKLELVNSMLKVVAMITMPSCSLSCIETIRSPVNENKCVCHVCHV
jgi:hypothetical protein